ncbi:SPJ_0845 family protein [Lactiplantibacillus daowaiensis]|uniref:SPJ_0845 family protein n=1 Tax=Lactiplantibacillus daowaiensis TaxID=2559918 RepID=A0ABW1RZV6_9LACO|nr:SPJ_0845 family protein [Lactiplantibacillus daowaiensis]
MSLKVQRQDNLDKLFDKFAIGPDDKDKLTTKAIQETIDEHSKRQADKSKTNDKTDDAK